MRRHRGVLLLLLLHLFCITLAPVWAEPNDYGTSPHSNEQLSQQKRRDARDLIDDTLVLTEVASSSNASSGDSSQPENKNNQDNATQKTSSDYSVLDKKASAVKAEVKTDESASEGDIPEVIPEVIVPGNITVCCSKVNDLKVTYNIFRKL